MIQVKGAQDSSGYKQKNSWQQTTENSCEAPKIGCTPTTAAPTWIGDLKLVTVGGLWWLVMLSHWL